MYTPSRNNPMLGGKVISPKILARVNAERGKNYVVMEQCVKCNSVWLCEPDGKGGYAWDTWALGTFFGRSGVVSAPGTAPRSREPVALAGFGNLKEGHSYIIDPKEAAKGHLVVLKEKKAGKKTKGFWSRHKEESS